MRRRKERGYNSALLHILKMIRQPQIGENLKTFGAARKNPEQLHAEGQSKTHSSSCSGKNRY